MRSVEADPRGDYALITGGAGFIGTNLAHRLASDGIPVLIFDNLSRAGVEENLEWLADVHGKTIDVEIADVRNAAAVRRAVRHARQVFHFAAQVAVTHSLDDPLKDFETNVRGTLNVLEAIRHSTRRPPLVFTSTNKVYGALADVPLSCSERYEPVDATYRRYGIGEDRSLDFHSPYGCSKGAADQYVLDFARTFKIPAAVFRMSCIYGLHQHGTEDQGWVAHFVLRAVEEEPIVLYGNGRQVRDILFADDLVEAFLCAQRDIDRISGRAFNIGGGPEHTVSLLELIDLLGTLSTGTRPSISFGDWRLGDQKYYVSDTRRFRTATGWAPAVDVRHGVSRLLDWASRRTFDPVLPLQKAASSVGRSA
jgi:CDP-paratose 2-epimerase